MLKGDNYFLKASY